MQKQGPEGPGLDSLEKIINEEFRKSPYGAILWIAFLYHVLLMAVALAAKLAGFLFMWGSSWTDLTNAIFMGSFLLLLGCLVFHNRRTSKRRGAGSQEPKAPDRPKATYEVIDGGKK